MLNLSVNYFMRTTDPAHIQAAQEFWSRCFKNEDIYKKITKLNIALGVNWKKPIPN